MKGMTVSGKKGLIFACALFGVMAIAPAGVLALGCDYGSCACPPPSTGTGTICCNEIDAGGLHDVGCFCMGCSGGVPTCDTTTNNTICMACLYGGSCGSANANHIITCSNVIDSCSNCVCNTKTTYRCEAGYWGSPTNASSGCTACPSSHPNSTAGSNSTQSTCNVSCTACSASSGATCTRASSTATYNNSCSYTTGCSAGYYGPASGAGTYNPTCTRCPDVTTSNGWSPNTITRTSTAGTTVPITSCYIPSGTTDIDDEIGTFTSSGICQYQL